MPETTPDFDESEPMFQLFEQPANDSAGPGFLEKATMQTVRDRTSNGWLGPGDAGPVALAIITARKVDRMTAKDAASGQANLLRAMKEIFEMLPQPEVVGADELGAVLEFVQAEEQGELVA